MTMTMTMMIIHLVSDLLKWGYRYWGLGFGYWSSLLLTKVKALEFFPFYCPLIMVHLYPNLISTHSVIPIQKSGHHRLQYLIHL
jgi:hypothetical protein